jgi:UDP-2,4-diacetamido-2,4,6-trideoxy-beta-L-altropyranose hydrolase
VNIIIRADASIHIGSGHIMRCLVLAEALKDTGHQVSFASRAQQGDSIEFVKKKGFTVHELVRPNVWLTPLNSADYAAWLQVPWQEDAQSLFENIHDIDLIIVDHYGLNGEWEQQVQFHYDCKVVVIDDLVRSHKADMIIDQTLLRDNEEYKLANPNTFLLTGCDYALLNPLFASYRKKQFIQVKVLSKPIELIVSMGGIDKPNATLKVLEALLLYKNKLDIHVTVLLSNKAPNYDHVKNFCLSHDRWITHLDFVENMAEILSQQCVAVGAPGGSSWERACLGIPNIIIPLAENQLDICHGLVKVGAALPLNFTDIESGFAEVFNTLIDEWATLRAANLLLCDGDGVLRVVQCINTLLSHTDNSIVLRRAIITDIKQVYEWQCMPETRKFALTPEMPTWEGHKSWMERKLQSTKDYFYIVETLNKQDSIGVLRLDETADGHYIISIFIDPAQFGQGFAKKVLTYVDQIHPDIMIQAIVLEENIASQRLFSAANYQQTLPDTFIRPPLM